MNVEHIHVRLDDIHEFDHPYVGSFDINAVRVEYQGRTYHLVADDLTSTERDTP